MAKPGTTLVLAAGLAIFAGSVHAQSRDAATAEALFRQGRAAMETKNYQEACSKFAESQKLDGAPGTLMNLATCEEKIGKLASAWQHWKEAIDALPPKDDRVAFARSRVDELEKKLPRLQVTLKSGADQGAKVFRDDIELGPAGQGVPLPVDPGAHTITVRMTGHFPKSVSVNLAVGEQSQVDVHPGAVDPNANANANVTVEPSNSMQTLGFALGGVGLAGLGTAVVSGIVLMHDKSVVQTSCDSVSKICRDQQGLDAASSAKTMLVVNTAGWIVAGLGLGAGAYFILSSSKSSTSAVAPTVGPQGASVSYVATF
jgi:hypothetical protein